jgi:hypothetical protein
MWPQNAHYAKACLSTSQDGLIDRAASAFVQMRRGGIDGTARIKLVRRPPLHPRKKFGHFPVSARTNG